MAKKKVTKKHKFKYTEPTTLAGVAPSAASSSAVAGPASKTGAVAASPTLAVDNGRYAYVGRDLRRIGVMLAALTVVEVGLWWVFAHTSVGTTVYAFFKV